MVQEFLGNTYKFVGERVCNILEAKRITVFFLKKNPLDSFFVGEKAHRPFFLKEAFDVVSVALRPSLSNSSTLECLRDLGGVC